MKKRCVQAGLDCFSGADWGIGILIICQHTSGNKKAEEDADKDTEQKLQEIKEIGNKQGKKVVDDLLRAVTDVKPVVPERVEQPVA